MSRKKVPNGLSPLGVTQTLKECNILGQQSQNLKSRCHPSIGMTMPQDF